MRFALCQMNPTVGDLAGNSELIVTWTQAAAAAGADLAVFPEQSLTGYPAEDLLLKQDFLRSSQVHLDALAARLPIPALVGYPEFVGGDVYNSCAVIAEGRVEASYRKQFLPNYGVFDEQRYFRAGTTSALMRCGDTTIGLTVCEDIWQPGPPASIEAAAGAHVIVNLSASPYRTGKGAERERMLATRAVDTISCIVFCNQVGGQDELVFDGHSLVMDHRGRVMARASQFGEEMLLCDLDIEDVVAARLQDTRLRTLFPVPPTDQAPVICTVEPGSRIPVGAANGAVAAIPVRLNDSADVMSEEEEVYTALQLGLRDYVTKNRFSKVLVAVSGGIDSTFVLALAVDALGADRVVAVTMPSRFSSADTRADAAAMCAQLAVELHELPIDPVLDSFHEALAPAFSGRDPDVTEENLQARIRGTLIMALSNKFGHLVLTTGNKSEYSAGYATLYGDMAGGFAPIKDISKSLLYRLCGWRNDAAREDGEAEPILESVIEREPSAELRHGQRDSDSLPPYELLDRILEGYVEQDKGEQELVEEGYDQQMVHEVIRLVDRAEYKRRQSPPGIKIGPKAFGRDRRLPITNRFHS